MSALEVDEKLIRLVWSVARSISHRMPRYARNPGDLISYGWIGLQAALETYNPSRGMTLETYCANKIRFAIIDGLRLEDWVPRNARRSMGQDAPGMLTATAVWYDEVDDFWFMESRDKDPHEAVAGKDLIEFAMAGLRSDRERAVIRMMILEGKTMKIAAKALGISEGRVCQIYHDCLVRLAKRMRLAGIKSAD